MTVKGFSTVPLSDGVKGLFEVKKGRVVGSIISFLDLSCGNDHIGPLVEAKSIQGEPLWSLGGEGCTASKSKWTAQNYQKMTGTKDKC